MQDRRPCKFLVDACTLFFYSGVSKKKKSKGNVFAVHVDMRAKKSQF